MGSKMTAIPQPNRASERGLSLVEVVFAVMVVMIAALGLMPLGAIATKTTENQGHLMARCTEYAQDKLEQLMGLQFGDAVTDTRVFPANPSGGTGLGGKPLAAAVGSADPDAPVDQFVDYLDFNGNLLDTAGGIPADWFYKRVWQITPVSDTLKQIEVTAIVQNSIGGVGQIPRATVSALKTYPF
jgi:hypothetical protein